MTDKKHLWRLSCFQFEAKNIPRQGRVQGQIRANLRKLAPSHIFFHQSSNGEILIYTLRLSSGYNDLLNSELPESSYC